jgi:hypothetical protein
MIGNGLGDFTLVVVESGQPETDGDFVRISWNKRTLIALDSLLRSET